MRQTLIISNGHFECKPCFLRREIRPCPVHPRGNRYAKFENSTVRAGHSDTPQHRLPCHHSRKQMSGDAVGAQVTRKTKLLSVLKGGRWFCNQREKKNTKQHKKQSHTLRSSTPNDVRKQQLRRQIWQFQRDAHTRTEEKKSRLPRVRTQTCSVSGITPSLSRAAICSPEWSGLGKHARITVSKLPRHEPGARVYIPGGTYLFLPLPRSFAFEEPSPKIEGRCKELIRERSSLPCER